MNKEEICNKSSSKIEVSAIFFPYIMIVTEIFLQLNKSQYYKGIPVSQIPDKVKINKEVYVFWGGGHYMLQSMPFNIFLSKSDTNMD